MSKQNPDLRMMVGETTGAVKGGGGGRNGKNERRAHGEGWIGRDEIAASKEARPSVVKADSRERFPEGERTYYNVPLLKKAHWGWEIYVYFYLGGIAGGSYLVSTLADLLDIKKAGEVIRAGRYLSLVCMMVSPLLLIKDLGRPGRFHHMLRVLKFRSAMSLGTWGLTAFGMVCGVTAGKQMACDGLLSWFPLVSRCMKALPVKVIESVGAVCGLFVASYTGVLLSSTAVPMWARAKYVLAPLFLSSALSTGLASLSLLVMVRGKEEQEIRERLENAEIVAMASELSLLAFLPRVLGPLGEPLFKGHLGTLFKVGTLGGGVMLPLLARVGWKAMGRQMPRGVDVGVCMLVLVGGMVLRYGWIVGGRGSADDVEAIHHYNRVEWEGRRRRG